MKKMTRHCAVCPAVIGSNVKGQGPEVVPGSLPIPVNSDHQFWVGGTVRT